MLLQQYEIIISNTKFIIIMLGFILIRIILTC